jgi:hypothetical protein
MKSEGKEFNESINFVSKNDKNENDESYEITLKVKQTILEHASIILMKLIMILINLLLIFLLFVFII